MNDALTTKLWMIGVMTVMAVYGLVAAIGYLRRKR